MGGQSTSFGTFTCGHDRNHRVPSDNVRILKTGGAGFIAACSCGDEPLEAVAEKPHQLGGHVTLIGGKGIDEQLWLILDDLADDWYDDPKSGTLGGSSAYIVRRAERAAEYTS